ncbi:hypothetical protein PCE1_003714 [Barthelona sp. PCE]
MSNPGKRTFKPFIPQGDLPTFTPSAQPALNPQQMQQMLLNFNMQQQNRQPVTAAQQPAPAPKKRKLVLKKTKKNAVNEAPVPVVQEKVEEKPSNWEEEAQKAEEAQQQKIQEEAQAKKEAEELAKLAEDLQNKVDEKAEIEENDIEITTDEEGDTRKHMNVIFIGHVDHGKSTLSGRIMVSTGNIESRDFQRFEREAKQKGRESWLYAYAFDTDEAEREKGKTIEVGQAQFETEHKRYTILDAPGHAGYVNYMIGGASQADSAVLVVSARSGEFEAGFKRDGQTQEHAMIAKTAGVKSLVVAINKMDDATCQWNESRYEEIKCNLEEFLPKIGFRKNDVKFLPVSGLQGVNITNRAPDSHPSKAFYDGPCLLEILDNTEPPQRLFDQPFRMPVTAKMREGSYCSVIGKIETGCVAPGDHLIISPDNSEVIVQDVYYSYSNARVERGEPGDSVRIKVKNLSYDQVHEGSVACAVDSYCKTARAFVAQTNIIKLDTILSNGFCCVMHMHSIQIEVSVDLILATLDKRTRKIDKKYPRQLMEGDSALIRFKPDSPIALELFDEFQQLGRFVLRSGGVTHGFGIVKKIIE